MRRDWKASIQTPQSLLSPSGNNTVLVVVFSNDDKEPLQVFLFFSFWNKEYMLDFPRLSFITFNYSAVVARHFKSINHFVFGWTDY